MTHPITIVNRPEVRLVVCRATEFPAGIKTSWKQLESKLDSLKGRKFYGLTCVEGSELVYYAGLEPLNDQEVEALGFPTMTIKAGKYARVKLMDWPHHAGEIPEIFGELMNAYAKDPAGPTIEFYKSQSELQLLMPLATED